MGLVFNTLLQQLPLIIETFHQPLVLVFKERTLVRGNSSVENAPEDLDFLVQGLQFVKEFRVLALLFGEVDCVTDVLGQ